MAGFRNDSCCQFPREYRNYYPAKWQGSETWADISTTPFLNYYPAKWQGSETPVVNLVLSVVNNYYPAKWQNSKKQNALRKGEHFS